MFNWLKGIKNAAEGAMVGGIAVNLWRQSLAEVTKQEGVARSYDIDFWREVAYRFIPKVESHPNFRVARSESNYQIRCDGYLAFLERMLDQCEIDFHSDDVEKAGEFIAFAVTRGPEEAIVADPERAGLIYHFLPPELVDAAGVPPEKFAELYRKATGREWVQQAS